VPLSGLVGVPTNEFDRDGLVKKYRRAECDVMANASALLFAYFNWVWKVMCQAENLVQFPRHVINITAFLIVNILKILRPSGELACHVHASK
jgi:ABC-type histidine transport system ATPase subunit